MGAKQVMSGGLLTAPAENRPHARPVWAAYMRSTIGKNALVSCASPLPPGGSPVFAHTPATQREGNAASSGPRPDTLTN